MSHLFDSYCLLHLFAGTDILYLENVRADASNENFTLRHSRWVSFKLLGTFQIQLEPDLGKVAACKNVGVFFCAVCVCVCASFSVLFFSEKICM